MDQLDKGKAGNDTDHCIRILLVDDHAVMRAGLANMLNAHPGFRVVAEAGDGETAISLFCKCLPDVVLMDVIMPGQDGIQTLHALRGQFPDARVLMLTSSEMEDDIIRSIKAGASGYITKSALPAELAAAIKTIYAGGRVMGPVIERVIAEQASGIQVTQRELEVLTLLRKGLSNADIGKLLDITPRTAKAHVAALLVKLEAADRAEAVARGFERGLLKP